MGKKAGMRSYERHLLLRGMAVDHHDGWRHDEQNHHDEGAQGHLQWEPDDAGVYNHDECWHHQHLC